MKIKIFSILAISSILFFSGCNDDEKIDSKAISTNTQEVVKSFDFELTKTNKEALTIHVDDGKWKVEGYEGKAILLDFFATWCPPCRAEIPHLNDLREKYKDKFEIIGIEVGERDGTLTNNDKLKSFIEEFKIEYPIVNSEENSRVFRSVSSLNRTGSIPFMILLNPNGEYVKHYIGMAPEEMIETELKMALGI